METFTKTNKSKKLILFLVLLMLFNFCCPKNIVIAAEESIGDIKGESDSKGYTYDNEEGAGGWFDLSTNFASLLFFMERGLFGLINDIFSDELHKYHYYVTLVGNSNEVDIQLFLTPESIIKGRYLLFNADIFDDVSDVEKDEPEKYYDDASDKSTVIGKTSLRETISGWYTALRTFSIVALLSVLVYVGIRMVISTIAQDKAKYKVMFKDWLVALCLLIVMHYIMIAILDISNLIVDAIGSSGAAGSQTEIVMEKIGAITSAKYQVDVTTPEGKTEEDVRAIYEDENGNLEYYNVGDAYAFEFLLVAILFYTILFAIKYLKREFTIMFLILLGPISCITYPIDKISDGKAQAFNKWFSEFLYQVIIQPFHLLIYIVLVGTATQLANDNLLYSIVCFAVMIPAEKFVKEMFGFRDKLGSPLGAMATGAAASQIFNKMKGGSSGGSKSNSGENDSTPNTLPPKTVNKDNIIGGGSNTPQISSANEDLSNGNAIGDGTENIPTAQALDAADDVAAAAVVTDAIDEATDNSANPDGTTLDEQMNEAQEQENLQRQIDNQVDESGTGGQQEGNTNEPIDDKQSKWERIKNSKPVGFISNKGKQALNIHNQRMAKKWGSTSRGKRWVNRGKKILGSTAKSGVRAATTLAGAATLGALGVMMGQGGKGALAGAALGNMAGNKVIKGVSNTGSDYYNGLLNEENREKQAFNEFRGDSKQIDKAVMSYRDRVGRDPTRKELNQEMKDRFALSRYDLSDGQIDNAIGRYKKLRNENGVSDSQALDQAVFAAQLSDDYSKKDFRSEKTMGEAVDSLAKDFIKQGMNEGLAEKTAREYLEAAADIKGTDIKLPPEKVYTTPFIGNMLNRAGISTPTKKVAQRAVNVYQQLENAGFDENSILQISSGLNFGTEEKEPMELETKVNSFIEFKNNEDAMKRLLGDQYTNADRNSSQVNQKIIERIDFANQVLGTSGVSAPSKEQIEFVDKQHYTLESAGFDKESILKISKGLDLANSHNTDTQVEVIRKVEKYVEYKNNNEAMKYVEEFIGNSDRNSREANIEVIERVEMGKTFNITDNKKIDTLRDIENELSKGNQKKIEEFRELGRKAQRNGGKLAKKDKGLLSKDEISIAELYAQSDK